MVNYGMVIDTTLCQGCSFCLFACKDEFVGNDYLPYSRAQPDTLYSYFGQNAEPDGEDLGAVSYTPGQTWMKDKEIVSGTFPNISVVKLMMPCLECQNPPCLAAATNGGAYQRPDGIVILDPVKSVGQTQIVDACPYGRIYWNSTLNIPQKCTFCAHKIDAGQNPKCVDACPLNAITFGDLSNPSSAISKLVAAGTAVHHPEYATKPNVTYIGLITGTEYV
jgi:Fe-S-cluster-containing dehydrogenase component